MVRRGSEQDPLAPSEAPAPEGVDIAPDGRLVTALIFLLAVCEQAAHELERADVAVDCLAGELEALSARLRDSLRKIA